jgi:signal transduction histidine kinase
MQANLGRAPNTVEAYGRALESYLSFVAQLALDPVTVGREQIALYVRDLIAASPCSSRDQLLAHLPSKPLSNATVQQRLTAVRLFYDFLVEAGHCSVNPAQEDERRRIARELHDQLGQNITALHLALTSLKTQMQMGTPQWDMVMRAEQLTTRLHEDARALAVELRPSNLEELGLFAAVQQHIEEWSAYYNIAAEVESIGPGQERLDAEIETVLYRVTQEALTNVAKHAQAEHVSIILERRSNSVHLTIEDDGQGFDLERVQQRLDAHRHLGIEGMHERTELVGGTLTIEATPGRGTTLFIQIPLSSHL